MDFQEVKYNTGDTVALKTMFSNLHFCAGNPIFK